MAQSYRYSEGEPEPLLTGFKAQPSLYFPEAQLNPLTAYAEAGTEAGTASGGMVTQLITQGHQFQPWSYSYRTVYPQIPLVFVYMREPYTLTRTEYATGAAPIQYLPTALPSSEEAAVNALLGPQGMALMNGVDTSLPTPPSKLTWYSIRQLATENPVQTKIRPAKDGNWGVSEQEMFQTLHPAGTPIPASQGLLSGEETGTDLASFPADLSGTASALSELAGEQLAANQATGALDATASLEEFYREYKNELGRVDTVDSSSAQPEVLQSGGARAAGQAGGGVKETSEQPSSVFSSEYKEQASGERASSSQNAEIRHEVVEVGGVKGGTKGMLQTQRKTWTQNKLMYSG